MVYPSRSLLFNIAQKYDGIGGAEEAAVLEVFMKVLNELQGYYGNQGYVAKFEYDLDTRGEFDGFTQTYLRVNKTNWTQSLTLGGRGGLMTLFKLPHRRFCVFEIKTNRPPFKAPSGPKKFCWDA